MTSKRVRKTSIAVCLAILAVCEARVNAQGVVDTTPRQAAGKVGRAAASAGQFVDDVAITTTVKAKLIADEATKARDIKVETRNGVVQLTGEVDNPREVRKAETIAHSVDGVQYVKNELKLKTP